MSNLLNDSEILYQVSLGNEKAFQQLFQAYRDRLFFYIARFVKSEPVAEELVLDVFMKIWIGRDLVVQIENFDAFLFRVAHNKSIDFLRSAAKDQRLKELLWDTIQAAGSDHADSSVLVHEYEEKLRQAISLLSPQRRNIYLLSREQDYTHDQIAEQLQISRSTVNNQLVEAQRFIRNFLTRNMELAALVLVAGKI